MQRKLKRSFPYLLGLLLMVLALPSLALTLTPAQKKRHEKFLSEFPIVDDPALNAYVTKIGKKVLALSPHADQDYIFVIRDNPNANAFVSGYPVVYVERGLLVLLNSEAELAAVMAHEIGHNVGNHIKKRQGRQARSQVLAFLTSFLVGNRGVGDAILTQSSVSEFQYTREAELEADRFAAKYLFEAGYEASQLIPALSQLVAFGNLSAAEEGFELPHHGLGATHPRSDKRLRKVVESAGELPPGEAYIGRTEYRKAIEGIVYGPNYGAVAPKGFERYTNERLGITLLHPETWSFQVKGAKLIMKDPLDQAQLKIEIEKTVDKTLTSKKALKAKHPDVVNEEAIHKDSQRDLGTLGGIPGQRVALATVGRNTFHFTGIAKNNQPTAEHDAGFVGIIRSFRRMTRADRTSETVNKVYFERLEPGDTFASLAEKMDPKDDRLENRLRVLNGYYPGGEAEPGTWIKKIRKEKVKKKAHAEPEIAAQENSN